MTVTTRAAAQRSASPQSAISQTSSRQESPTKTSGSPSDGEGRILRPTRRKLAKTSIDGPENPTPTEEPLGRTSLDSFSEAGSVVGDEPALAANGSRGRLRRKRSFEEVGEEHGGEKVVDVATKHQRKRSRDVRKEGVELDDGSLASASEDSDSLQPDEDTTTSSVDATIVTTSLEKELAENPASDASALTDKNMDAAPVPEPKDAHQDHLQAERPRSPQINKSANELTTTNGKAEPDGEHETNTDEAKSPAGSNTATESSVKVPPSSGFANSSIQSPFAAIGQGKPSFANSQPQTSSSAFASSGFAALSGQSQSPFGTLPLPAKPVQPALAESTTTAPPSGFAALGAAASGPSPFASAGSGFGTGFGSHRSFGDLGNGLGKSSTSSFGGGFGGFGQPLSKLSSSEVSAFVPSSGSIKPIGTSTFASSGVSIKPIGAATDEDGEEAEGSGGEEDSEAGPAFVGEDERDERFYKQDLATGEEDEITVFKGRAKLYMMGDDKAWKERGTGDFKVNSRIEDSKDSEDEAGKPTARFLMRVDGSHRVVLNSPITKDIKVEDPTRGAPKGKTAVFLGWVDGKLVTLQLKMRDNIQTTALYDAVNKVQAKM